MTMLVVHLTDSLQKSKSLSRDVIEILLAYLKNEAGKRFISHI